MNGIPVPHLALLRGSSVTFAKMTRPYASVDFILGDFNQIEFQWFESEHGKGAGARKRAEREIREFVWQSRGCSETAILEAVEKTTELAIITPLADALNRCESADEIPAYVLLSELEASKATTICKFDVSSSLAELETAAAIDKN